jgi:hypothetical protein
VGSGRSSGSSVTRKRQPLQMPVQCAKVRAVDATAPFKGRRESVIVIEAPNSCRPVSGRDL